MYFARGAVLGALLALPASLSAQIAGTATVVGEVTDSVSGHGVDGAVVLVSGTLLRVRTDAGGRFRLAGLPPGHYSITVLGIGYERDSVPMLDLGAGETRSLEIPLHPAPVGLADVVVTAAMAPEQSAASAASIAVLTEAEVRRRNVVTIDQALVYVPGITLNGPDQLDIRGAAGFARGVGSRVLLMLDGHPILSGDGAEIDFESLPLLDLAHVEVVKGAYSAQYGSNALGGVVNLITEPVRSAARTVLQVHAGVYQPQQPYRVGNQTRSFRDLGIQHEQRIGELGARLFVGRETSDGFEQNGATSRWLVRGKLTSPPAAEHPWDLYALWVRERAGEFFIWQADSLPYRVDTTTGSVGDHTWATKLLTGGSWTALSRPGALLRLSPYLNYNTLQNEFQHVPDTIPNDPRDNHDHHAATRIGANAQLTLAPATDHEVTLGTDLARTEVRANFLGRPSINDAALFGQDAAALALGGRLRGSFGVRLDYHKANYGDAEFSVSPKIGVVYRTSARLTSRASIGHGYRAPSAIEQFVNTVQYTYHVVPNPALHGETAWSGETGVTALPWSRVRLDAAVFQSSYRQLIGPAQAPGQPFGYYQFRNVSRARVQGLDVGVKASTPGDVVDATASYLFLHTKDLDTDKALPYRSAHNVTGSVNVFGGAVGVDVRYRSRVEEVLVYPLDARGAATVLDVRLAYQALGAIVQAKVTNLFNRFYVDVQERSAGAPRSIGVTATRTF